MTEPHGWSETIRANRAAWDRDSDAYQARHDEELGGERAVAWGLWRTPESELDVFEGIDGKDFLEVGCGAARFSIGLAGLGARPVGLDVSFHQLSHALRLRSQSEVDFPLLQAGAESLPFADRSFDVVFSDYGGHHWGDPYRTIEESARVLRTGGLLAFSTTTPIVELLWPDDPEADVGTTLTADYFGMHTRPDPEGGVAYQVPYGEWIRLFRGAGLVIEDLIEVRPPENARTSYAGRPVSWARRWPAEMIWKARKP